MAISISYLPSNAISAYISQSQVGVASQNATTTQADPLATAQSTSASSQTASSQSSSASVITQLSVAGQVKSSLADLQDKAVALKSISKSPNISDFQVVVQGFTQAFNSLNNSLKELSSKQSAPRTDNFSRQTLQDVRKAAAGDNGNALTSLQKLGISPQPNGTLSVNQNQLAKSFKENPAGTLSTITDFAKRIAQTVNNQLSNSTTNTQNTGRTIDKQITGKADETEAASIATGTQDRNRETRSSSTGNVAETQVSSSAVETPAPGNSTGTTLPDSTTIDKKVNDSGAPVSRPENRVDQTNTNSTAQNSADTHSQQPAQPLPPVQLPPPVQTPGPVTNTARAAVTAFTSIAAI